MSSTPDSSVAKEELEAAGMTAVEMDLRGVGRQLFGINSSLMQAKESACNTLYQYTEDLGDRLAAHAARALAVVLPNLGPRNAVAVQVVSAAVIPRLVGISGRRAAAAKAASAGDAVALVAEADAMLDASIRELCRVVSNISGDLGAALEAGGGDMEPACIAADSLSTLLGDHSGVQKPSPLSVTAEREMGAVRVLRDAVVASVRRTQVRFAKGAAGGRRNPLSGMTGAVDRVDREEQEGWEEDIINSAADGIGWVIKKRRESFIPIFESELKPLMLSLLAEGQSATGSTATLPSLPKPAPHKSFGLCVGIDILEHAGEPGRQAVLSALLPALVDGYRDEAASTRQTCAYGLGVAGEHGGPGFDVHAASCLQLLTELAQVTDPEDEDLLSVADNAVSGALRLIIHRVPALAESLGCRASDGKEAITSSTSFQSLMSTLLARLPLTTDVTEAHDCHRRIVALANALDPTVLGGSKAPLVARLVTAIARMMVYQTSPHEEAMADETEEKMWERQLVDPKTRMEAERALGVLQGKFALPFKKAWSALDDETMTMAQTPTASFGPVRSNARSV